MFEKPKRKVNKVFIHCSASDNPDHDTIDVIRDWHVYENGFRDVGYHYFITKAGDIEIGRDIEEIPAAQKGHNTGSIAICLSGLDEDRFTEDQFETLRELCLEIHDAYDGKITFHGHCEVSNKTCPVFDYVSVLELNKKGKLGYT